MTDNEFTLLIHVNTKQPLEKAKKEIINLIAGTLNLKTVLGGEYIFDIEVDKQ